jgi:threonine dehydratase
MDQMLRRVFNARVSEVLPTPTPLDRAAVLSQRLGRDVLLKREDLTPVFSFKLRGAYNAMAALDERRRRAGVIAASAGNHAQGVALAAQRRGIPAVIVMPQTTPSIKVKAVRDLGGEVVLHGDDYDSAYEHAQTIVRERNLAFVHPFDDPDVIAGQGTIAVEILRQSRGDIDAIFVPVGGGGLISGIAVYAKYLNPRMKIIGVEPVDAAAMHDSLREKKRVTLERVGIFADGVAVRRVGEETFRLCREYVDEIVLVNTDEICAGIQDVFEDTRSIVEGAGALAVAGIKKYCALNQWKDKRIVALNSGANMNFDQLRYVAERSDLGQAREALLAVEIPEQPGSFLRFCEVLGSRAITEFNYRYGLRERAQIFVGFGLARGREERDEVSASLRAAGYGVTDMTDNEIAKLHVRYMVGGHVNGSVGNERLFRFEFPERKGALLKFLQAVGTRWNITLFHYRNHGSDYGRVLAGIDVPSADSAEFLDHLNVLHYSYTEETNNPVYRIFLGT